MLAIVICATRITRILSTRFPSSQAAVCGSKLSRVPSGASFLIHGCVGKSSHCSRVRRWCMRAHGIMQPSLGRVLGASLLLTCRSLLSHCRQRAHNFCSPLVFTCLQPLRRGNLRWPKASLQDARSRYRTRP